MAVYILEVADDTPYHEGKEKWFRRSLSEIVEIARESWDWMGEREVVVIKIALGAKTHTLVENVLPEQGAKWASPDPDVLSLWPPGSFDGGSQPLYVCSRCEVYETRETRPTMNCRYCDESLEDAEDAEDAAAEDAAADDAAAEDAAADDAAADDGEKRQNAACPDPGNN